MRWHKVSSEKYDNLRSFCTPAAMAEKKVRVTFSKSVTLRMDDLWPSHCAIICSALKWKPELSLRTVTTFVRVLWIREGLQAGFVDDAKV